MLAASPIHAAASPHRSCRAARHASVTGTTRNKEICPNHIVLDSAALLSTIAAASIAGIADQPGRSVTNDNHRREEPGKEAHACQSKSPGPDRQIRERPDQQMELRRVEVGRLGESRRSRTSGCRCRTSASPTSQRFTAA